MSAPTPSRTNTRKLVMLGMLSAIAYLVMLVGRVPVVLFLKYDPKDVVITIAGFLFGPASAAVVSLVVSVVEMFTVSDTGPIGLVMNVLSSCAFACTASYIYSRKRTMRAAAVGVASGCLLSTAVMLLWNYLITPLYMHVERAAVVALLLPAFLPFNLLKGSLNAALTILLYRSLLPLRQKRFADQLAEPAAAASHKGILIGAAFVLGSCVLAILVMQGIL
jgi:Predicted membrane protein